MLSSRLPSAVNAFKARMRQHLRAVVLDSWADVRNTKNRYLSVVRSHVIGMILHHEVEHASR